MDLFDLVDPLEAAIQYTEQCVDILSYFWWTACVWCVTKASAAVLLLRWQRKWERVSVWLLGPLCVWTEERSEAVWFGWKPFVSFVPLWWQRKQDSTSAWYQHLCNLDSNVVVRVCLVYNQALTSCPVIKVAEEMYIIYEQLDHSQ